MLLNRIVERARALSWRRLMQAKRGHAVVERAPLVLIPGMCGTRLVDDRGRVVWGSLARMYTGQSIASATRAAGLLEGVALVPGLVGVDIYGGLVRFLERVGGYRRGEDLFVLDYDWRAGAIDGAIALERMITGIRGFGEERIDLMALSTGGLVARAYLAEHGGAAIRRIVYIGAPQRGSFDALACLHRGFRFAPGGKVFGAREAAALQITFDALPHPDEKVFIDNDGRMLDLDLYDANVWTKLHLGEVDGEFATRLENARALHRRLEAARYETDSFVIGAGHLPTPARARVHKDRVHIPAPRPSATDPFVSLGYVPGDGELAASSLRALPDLDEKHLWWVTPTKHSGLPSNPEVHQLALEALLGTDRMIPKTDLRKLTVLRTAGAETRVPSATP
jgi:pimeloyl-ACP methyl ester carboxylesterase